MSHREVIILGTPMCTTVPVGVEELGEMMEIPQEMIVTLNGVQVVASSLLEEAMANILRMGVGVQPQEKVMMGVEMAHGAIVTVGEPVHLMVVLTAGPGFVLQVGK